MYIKPSITPSSKIKFYTDLEQFLGLQFLMFYYIFYGKRYTLKYPILNVLYYHIELNQITIIGVDNHNHKCKN